MKNSTFSQDYLKCYPDRFIECFIAEQNMVSVLLLASYMERDLVSKGKHLMQQNTQSKAKVDEKTKSNILRRQVLKVKSSLLKY